jgi:hypothetical protein
MGSIDAIRMSIDATYLVLFFSARPSLVRHYESALSSWPWGSGEERTTQNV